MTDTSITDAVVFPQDDGTGVPDGSESYDSAGSFSLLSRYKGDGNYVGEDTSGDATLQFNDVDTSNNEFDVGTGHAYISDSVSIQSGAQTSYDTTLPDDVPYVVVLPNEVTNLSLDSGTNDVWLAVDPTANDDVYIRHGSGLSAPSDPSVKLGTVDASSGATTRGQDNADTTFSSVQTTDSFTDPAGVTHTGELADASDVGGGGGGSSIGKIDSAETFQESDVTVAGGLIDAEAVKIGVNNGTTASREADNSSNSETYARGVVINPNTDLGGVKATLSGNMGSVSEVFVATTSETVLASQTGSFGPGDTVTLSASLSANTDYYVALWDEGASYTYGSNSTPTYPYSSTDVDIPTSCFGAHPDDGQGAGTIDSSVYCISDVTALLPKTDDSVTVEWPDPPDVFRWDSAVFQTTPNDGSVSVYVEANDGGGWTEVAGPIARGDSIPADPSYEVRLRADLSRPSASDVSPTLDAVYRRWVV